MGIHKIMIEEKLNLCSDIAWKIIEKDRATNNKLVWAYAEGHMHQRIEKLMFGRCSMQAYHDFDQEKEEKYIDEDIINLLEVLNN